MKPRKEFFFSNKVITREHGRNVDWRTIRNWKWEKLYVREVGKKKQYQEKEHLLFPMGLCNQLRVLNAQDISLPAAGSNIK